MQTLEIKVPDNKAQLVKDFLKGAGIPVKTKKENKGPNTATIAAMNELKKGKGKKFMNADELFSSI